MSAFWHPISAVYLREPRALASPVVVRLMLAGEGRADLVYAGDRMWPAVRHGQEIEVRPLAPSGARRGEVVLALDAGVLDVVRIRAAREGLRAVGDADPAPARPLQPGEVIGRIEGITRSVRLPSTAVRGWLDLVEAVTGVPDGGDDPAATVRDKYDEQATQYARGDGPALDPVLQARLQRWIPRGARILVAGSGSGREVFALEALGYQPRGVDFSPRMVDQARAHGARRGSLASFAAADLRTHDEPRGSLDAVLFTYDVYSFVPRAESRVELLRRMRGWLTAGGWLLLSARRMRGLRGAATLTVQRVARAAKGGGGEWGDSHTRWLDGEGRLRRSFVRVFSDRQLDAEAAAAGFRRLSWEGGHGLYARDPDRSAEAVP